MISSKIGNVTHKMNVWRWFDNKYKERYSDVTLACEGKFYSVHKLILSVCSDYFDAIFEKTPCKHPVIVLRDVVPDDLEALLSYMYEGIASVPQADLNRLIKTAEFLKVKGLAAPDEPIVVTDGQRVSNVATAVPTVNNNPPTENRSGSPQPKKRRREIATNNTTETATGAEFQAGLAHESNGETQKSGDFDPVVERVDLQASQVSVASERVTQRGIFVVDSIVKEEIKIDPDTINKANTSEAATATLVSTYGVVVSDGSGNHTLMQPHSDQTHVVTHRFDPAQMNTSTHSQPLAEAVAEALAVPSGMPTWIGPTELSTATFTAVEAYNAESGEVHSARAPTIQLVSAENASTVTVVTPSTEVSVPVTNTHVVVTTSTTQANGSKSSSGRGDGSNHLKCHYCNRSTFRQTSDLKRHIRIHTGEKPYECSFCPYRASRKDLLHAHCSKMHNSH